MIGFEEVTSIPRLGVAYATAIITQLDLALWELKRGYVSPVRKSEIRRNRRWLEGLTAEAEQRKTIRDRMATS